MQNVYLLREKKGTRVMRNANSSNGHGNARQANYAASRVKVMPRLQISPILRRIIG